jgi:hypothetical protein
VPRRVEVCEERHPANGFASQAIWNRTIYLGTVADRLTDCRGQLGNLVQWIDKWCEGRLQSQSQVDVGSRRLECRNEDGIELHSYVPGGFQVVDGLYNGVDLVVYTISCWGPQDEALLEVGRRNVDGM